MDDMPEWNGSKANLLRCPYSSLSMRQMTSKLVPPKHSTISLKSSRSNSQRTPTHSVPLSRSRSSTSRRIEGASPAAICSSRHRTRVDRALGSQRETTCVQGCQRSREGTRERPGGQKERNKDEETNLERRYLRRDRAVRTGTESQKHQARRQR